MSLLHTLNQPGHRLAVERVLPAYARAFYMDGSRVHDEKILLARRPSTKGKSHVSR